jgi:hypothetical protein
VLSLLNEARPGNRESKTVNRKSLVREAGRS